MLSLYSEDRIIILKRALWSLLSSFKAIPEVAMLLGTWGSQMVFHKYRSSWPHGSCGRLWPWPWPLRLRRLWHHILHDKLAGFRVSEVLLHLAIGHHHVHPGPAAGHEDSDGLCLVARSNVQQTAQDAERGKLQGCCVDKLLVSHAELGMVMARPVAGLQ